MGDMANEIKLLTGNSHPMLARLVADGPARDLIERECPAAGYERMCAWKGRLPADEVLLDYVARALAPKDLAGLRVAVTAGPTQEAIDPVRCLTNHSTGKMGYAVARAAALRGAEVTLIHGPTALQPLRFVRDVPVTSAQEMLEAVTGCFAQTDGLVMAAAVAATRSMWLSRAIRFSITSESLVVANSAPSCNI